MYLSIFFKVVPLALRRGESVNEWLSLTAFPETADIEVHYNPYKLCDNNVYTGIFIFPHIDNPQSTGLSWLVFGDSSFTSVYI